MQRTTTVTAPSATPRRTLLSGPLVLGCALIVGACSGADTESQATTTSETPGPTIVDTLPEADATLPTTPDEPGLAEPEPEPEPEPSDPANVIDDVVAELGAQGFSGTVMVQGPDGVASAGFGLADRSVNAENQVDTIFDIGSVTKQFTAAAILRLEMDGRLSVDDPIGMYVDGLSPSQSEITLHQLLTHTGGVPHSLGPDDEVITLPEYIARLATDRAGSTPIGEFAYSNVGYSLLAAAIETVTGDSYEVYLRDALFEPAGMEQTGYVLADWTDATIAVGYDDDEVFGRPNEQPWAEDGPWWHLRGNGGLLSSMPDMLRWDAALRGDEILDAAAKERMFTRHTPVSGDGEAFYGYGWILVPLADGTTLIQHSGGNHVFFADVWRFVEHDTTIVLASNVADPAAFDIGDVLAAALLGPELFGGPCELGSITSADAAAFAVLDDFPDTPTGRAMETWIGILLDGASTGIEDEAMEAYISTSIGEGFLDQFGADELVELIRALQDEFDGNVVERIHQEGDATFHVVVADTGGDEVVISARIGAEPDVRIECTGFPL